MQTYGVLAEITDTVFFESIGGISFDEVIKKVEKSKEKQIHHFMNETKNGLVNIKMEDLFYIKKISASQFGSVHMIRDNYGNFYALKSYNKIELIEY